MVIGHTVLYRASAGAVGAEEEKDGWVGVCRGIFYYAVSVLAGDGAVYSAGEIL